MFAIQHSAYEMPNFFSNRIAVSARIISPPQSPAPHYVRYPFRAAVYRTPTQAPSPLDAISDGLKDRLKAIYPGTLWYGFARSLFSFGKINNSTLWMSLMHYIIFLLVTWVSAYAVEDQRKILNRRFFSNLNSEIYRDILPLNSRSGMI